MCWIQVQITVKWIQRAQLQTRTKIIPAKINCHITAQLLVQETTLNPLNEARSTR